MISKIKWGNSVILLVVSATITKLDKYLLLLLLLLLLNRKSLSTSRTCASWWSRTRSRRASCTARRSRCATASASRAARPTRRASRSTPTSTTLASPTSSPKVTYILYTHHTKHPIALNNSVFNCSIFFLFAGFIDRNAMGALKDSYAYLGKHVRLFVVVVVVDVDILLHTCNVNTATTAYRSRSFVFRNNNNTSQITEWVEREKGKQIEMRTKWKTCSLHN